jgi:hypothetical protein
MIGRLVAGDSNLQAKSLILLDAIFKHQSDSNLTHCFTEDIRGELVAGARNHLNLLFEAPSLGR